jgi:GNAT superfamily N-acetyltransferase
MAVATIRMADVEDARVLGALVEHYWRFERIQGYDRLRIATLLEILLGDSRAGAAWLAYDGASAIGYLLAVYVFSLENGGLTAEIDELYVLDDHRGAGVGAQLVAVSESFLAGLGCKNVALQLGRDNHAGRAFYEKRGYSARSAYELLEKNL